MMKMKAGMEKNTMEMEKVVYYVVLRPHGSRETRTFAFRAELCLSSNGEAFHLPLREHSVKYLERLTPLGRSLVEAIARIQGPIVIRMGRHDMEIVHAMGFRWARDLQPQVIKTIEQVCGSLNFQAVQRRRRRTKQSENSA